MKRAVVFALAAVFCAAAAAADGKKDAKTALLIANGDYGRDMGALTQPVAEAAELKTALESIGFRVTLIQNENLDGMRRALKTFREQTDKNGGIAFFHYGGHAVQVSGANYLIPLGASLDEEADVSYRCLKVDELMQSMKGDANVVVLDSCRNNPFALSRHRGADTRGLAAVGVKPKNAIIVYSAAEGKTAQDGIFTPILTKRITEKSKSIYDVLREVRGDVYNATGGKQKPISYDELFSALYLAGVDTAVQTAAQAPQALSEPAAQESLAYAKPAAVQVRRGSPVMISQIKKAISFKDEKGALFIKNNMTANVVIFVGNIEHKIILGGIKGETARAFDLRKIPYIPVRGTFLIRVILHETIRQKTFITGEDVVFTGLVTYNLKDEDDKPMIIIPSVIDEKQQFYVSAINDSENYILELRIDNPRQGRIVAALPPLSKNNRIYLSPRDDELAYSFYPEFVFANPKTGEKTSIKANEVDQKRMLPVNGSSEKYSMRFSPPLRVNTSYDVAFINLQNNTNTTVIFTNGKTTLKNQKGIGFIPSERISVYEIPVANGDAGQTYSELFFEFDDFRRISMSPYKFKAGYKYDVIVTQVNGTYQYDIREVGQKSLVEDGPLELLFE